MTGQTITRADIADKLHENVGLSRAESSSHVDDFFDEIMTGLDLEGQVKLSAFGTFSVKEKSERIGRNPKTKEEAVIDSRKVVSFKASHILKEKMNEKNK